MHIDEYVILQLLFDRTSAGGFVTLYELEVEFGSSGTVLRSFLEDLKEKSMVIETENGFEISRSGMNYAKTRWV